MQINETTDSNSHVFPFLFAVFLMMKNKCYPVSPSPPKSIGIHLLNVQRHEDEGGKKESKNNNPTFKSCPEIKSFLIFISAMCYSAVASLLLETLLGIC
jgi:hypothetical protein